MEQFIEQNIWILFILSLWVLPWKGWALWRSARFGHRAWFIVLLIVQTLAILDILYIFVFSKRKSKGSLDPQSDTVS